VLLYMPAYRSVEPPAPEQRHAQTFGMVTASLAVDAVMQDLDDDAGTVALALTDVTQPEQAQRFYAAPTWRNDADARVHSATLDLYGRRWQVDVQALPPFVERLNLRSPATVAAAVAATTVWLALLLAARLRAVQREQVIAHERSQVAAVVDSSHDAIIRHTLQGRVLGWNAAAQRLLGWRGEEALHRDLMELTVPLERCGEARELMQRVQRGEDVPPFDTVRLDHQGQDVDVSLSVSPIRDAHGRTVGAATTMRDIRAQRAAQERILDINAMLEAALQQLRDSESQARYTAQLLEQLIESAPDPIWMKNQQGRLVALNTATATMIGRPREALLGLADSEVLSAADAAAAQAEDQHILDEGQPIRVEQTDARRGEPRVFSTIKAPIRAPDGHISGIAGIARDVTEHKAAEARLAELNATLEKQVQQRTTELQLVSAREHAIVVSAGSAIITTDLRGLVTSLNPAAQSMFRTTAVQAVGRSVLEFYDPQELAEKGHDFPERFFEHAPAQPQLLWQAVQRRGALSGEPGPRTEWTFVRADGTRFPGLLSVSLLRDTQGEVIGFLGMIADLTERRRMEDQLRQRTRQAEAASQAKSAFLAHMSHELRTPLNAVIGLSHLLAQMSLPERAAGFVRHIEQAGDQLLALVNDVLDLSRIEAGELQLEAVPFDLRSLLDAVHAMVRPQAEAKGLELQLDVPAKLPAQVIGDPLRLKQVLLNLVGNAVKFTPSGSVVLRVLQMARADGRATLRFDVMDTGIGIAPEQQRRIFEPFTQADSSTTRRLGGTGLGLSIVQRLVSMMGGQLELSSQLGKGSTFSVTLALQATPDLV
jgi:PAS domain S-box-containing protein